MSGLCLTPDEIVEVTGKVRFSAQARELNRLGVDHEFRGNGTILVYRSAVERQPNGKKKASPDFGAIKGVA